MKVYYAHCQAIYDTKQEERDVETLKRLGFEVENPNTQKHQDVVQKIKGMYSQAMPDAGTVHIMHYFANVVEECDCLAFRALPDGSIPAGVATEITVARNSGKPIFELPSGLLKRSMNVEETREYLMESGQR